MDIVWDNFFLVLFWNYHIFGYRLRQFLFSSILELSYFAYSGNIIFCLLWKYDILFIMEIWYFAYYGNMIFCLFWKYVILLILEICYFAYSGNMIFCLLWKYHICLLWKYHILLFWKYILLILEISQFANLTNLSHCT